MTVLRGSEIRDYADARGNRIVGTPKANPKAVIEFRGSDCVAVFGENVLLHGAIVFHRDNSKVTMKQNGWLRGRVTLGLDSSVQMGEQFNSGPAIYVTVAEGAQIIFGDDVLMARSCSVRADDSHPIYDGVTGARINRSRTITVGDHVWMGQEVLLMSGATIGSGSVIGARSVVTASRPVPENVIAVGSPARVRRTKILWVNKHLQMDDDVDHEIDPEFEPEVAIIEQSLPKPSRLDRLRRAAAAFMVEYRVSQYHESAQKHTIR